MSTSTFLLVFLWLCLYLASGFPVAKRFPGSQSGDDVLAGSDFLSIFMQRSDHHSESRLTPVFSDRNMPPHFKLFSPHDIQDHDIDSRIVKTPLSNFDQQEIQSGYPVETIAEEKNSSEEHKKMPPEASEYQFTTPHLTAPQELESNTTTQRSSESTTGYEEDMQTTLVDVEDSYVSTQSVRQDRSTKPSISKYWLKTDTEHPTSSTTESEEQPLQVISVRVSSSVVRQKPRKYGSDNKPQTTSEEPIIPKDKEEETIVGTLHIQEEPKITAVQRSQFAVEEEPSSEDKSYSGSTNRRSLTGVYGYGSPAEVEAAVEEVRRVHHTENTKSKNQKLAERTVAYHNPPEALRSQLQQDSEHHTQQADNKTSGTDGTETLSYQDSSYGDPQSAPVSYHTSVSSATSGSQVRFYSEPPSYKRRGGASVAETVHTPVILEKPKLNTQNDGQNTQFGEKQPNTNQRIGDAQYTEKPTEHQERAEKNYEVPEEVYGTPEENYEVDESVSVMTNGRAHGVQTQTPSQPTQGTPQTEDDQKSQEPNHKFGYVVEGRNFRKYRVEERTPDGFIVGEYGVVSHDDGSLRGVRYTADSNINPRLIYDALVKFLSLK